MLETYESSESEESDVDNDANTENKDLKRRKKQQMGWLFERRFNSQIDALKHVKDANSWSIAFTNQTADGRKVHGSESYPH